jgi:hypothetical protein
LPHRVDGNQFGPDAHDRAIDGDIAKGRAVSLEVGVGEGVDAGVVQVAAGRRGCTALTLIYGVQWRCTRILSRNFEVPRRVGRVHPLDTPDLAPSLRMSSPEWVGPVRDAFRS